MQNKEFKKCFYLDCENIWIITRNGNTVWWYESAKIKFYFK